MKVIYAGRWRERLSDSTGFRLWILILSYSLALNFCHQVDLVAGTSLDSTSRSITILDARRFTHISVTRLPSVDSLRVVKSFIFNCCISGISSIEKVFLSPTVC